MYTGTRKLIATATGVVALGTSLACGTQEPTAPVVADLAFAAAVTASGPDSVRAELTITNRRSGSLRLRWSLCAGTPYVVWVNVYRSGGGIDRVWTSFGREAVENVPCFGNIVGTELGSRDSLEFTSMLAVSEILGDSLPAGVYRFTVSPRLFEPELRANVAAADLEFEAGELMLTAGM